MTKTKLTDLTIRSLSVDVGQKRYFDDTTPGFGVTVGKQTKTWFVIRGANRKLTTIGRYPEISLQDARKTARRLLTQEPDKTRPTRLVDAVADYLVDIEERLRPSSVATYSKFLKNPPDISLKDLKKTSVTLAEPNAIKTWKVFANWCLRNELLDRNPFQFIKVEYGERERVLTNDEIKLLWAYDYPPFSDYLKVLLLTGQRRSQFTDFEIRDDTIFFPARIMKGKRDHTIPLTPLAHKYIKQLADRKAIDGVPVPVSALHGDTGGEHQHNAGPTPSWGHS